MKSRRRSTTTTPPDPVFFIDRNLGAEALPNGLRAAGFRLVVHDDHFQNRQDVYDPEVISACGRNGWFLLTGDKDMPRRWSKEIVESRIGVFCQTNNRHGPKLWIPRICYLKHSITRFALKEPRPFVAFMTAEAIPQLLKKEG